MQERLGVSERRACIVLGQHRSTQRKPPTGPDDEAALTADIIALARQYGRYGYRRIAALLRTAGWAVNKKRVERIWRREGLKVPSRQPKRGRMVSSCEGLNHDALDRYRAISEFSTPRTPSAGRSTNFCIGVSPCSNRGFLTDA
jgi:transposase InsO family protein